MFLKKLNLCWFWWSKNDENLLTKAAFFWGGFLVLFSGRVIYKCVKLPFWVLVVYHKYNADFAKKMAVFEQEVGKLNKEK
jgi:hypothetical protein